MTDTVPNDTAPEAVLFKKIASVLGDVGYVQKKGWNSFHKYHYVTEADLVDAVRVKLAAQNVALIPSVEAINERPVSKGVVTTVTMAFTFVDGDTGAIFKATWAGQGEDPSDKGLYKAYTGAVKYFLMKTFLIATGDDPESEPPPAAAPPAPAPDKLGIGPGELANELTRLAKDLVDAGVWEKNKVKAQLVAAGARNTNSVSEGMASLFEADAQQMRSTMKTLLEHAKASA